MAAFILSPLYRYTERSQRDFSFSDSDSAPFIFEHYSKLVVHTSSSST